MKQPKNYATNTTVPAGRTEGQLEDDPGGGTGSGVTAEADNDNIYACIAIIQSYLEGGISDSDETTIASDMRDAIEQLTHKRVTHPATPADTLDEWDAGTTYVAAGELVTWKGFQFVAFNLTGNLNKDPLLNTDFWHMVPKPYDLLTLFNSGRILPAGMSAMMDRAGGDYQQNIAFGRYRLGGNGDAFYNFYRVALDGTQVTGDGTLEAIFDPGGSNEYPYIDIFAPDVVGTRTLLDLGEYVPTPQSASGENDTLGEIQDDRFQGHWHFIQRDGIDEATEANPNGGGTGTPGDDVTRSTNAGIGTGTRFYSGLIATDGVNGTPRIGATSRPKEITEGAASIIVMIPV